MTACYQEYGGQKSTVDDALTRMVDGIFLNIDNSLLAECQKAANEAMIRVCGDTANCDNVVVDDAIGTRSFKYEVCQYNTQTGQFKPGVCRTSVDALTLDDLRLQEYQKDEDGNVVSASTKVNDGWAAKLSGIIYWQNISYNPETNSFTTPEEYIQALKDTNQAVSYLVTGEQSEESGISKEEMDVIKDRIFALEIGAMAGMVSKAISAIESDQKVQYCMNGRSIQGLRKGKTQELQKLGTRGSDEARFPNLTAQMRETIALSALKKARNNYMKKYGEEMERLQREQVKAVTRVDKGNRMDAARTACAGWAESSKLPESTILESPALKALSGMVNSAAIIAAPFTGGASLGALAMGYSLNQASEGSTTENYNYKESITTMFNEANGDCTKITVTQNCEEPKNRKCKKWADPVETKTVINLVNE